MYHSEIHLFGEDMVQLTLPLGAKNNEFVIGHTNNQLLSTCCCLLEDSEKVSGLHKAYVRCRGSSCHTSLLMYVSNIDPSSCYNRLAYWGAFVTVAFLKTSTFNAIHIAIYRDNMCGWGNEAQI